MGLWEMYPYMNTEQLNIDYVLGVVARANDVIKNINATVETVVRPMLSETESFVQSYYNRLASQVSREISDMISSNRELDSRVTRRLNENVIWINKKDASLRIAMQDVDRRTGIAVSTLRGDVNNLIAQYNAIWGTNAANQNAHINRIIADFTNDINMKFAENTADMNQIKNDLELQLEQSETELTAAINHVNMILTGSELHISELLGNSLDEYTRLAEQTVQELQDMYTDVHQFYVDFQTLFDDTFDLFSERINQKSDTSYVDREIERVIEMIVRVNGDILVINPTTNMKDTLQDTLFDIYKSNNPWALTAQEYDNLRVTADRYDIVAAGGMNATNYDTLGKYYLDVNADLLKSANEYTDAQINTVWHVLNNAYVPWIQDIENTNNERYRKLAECCENIKKLLRNELYMNSPFTGYVEPLADVILSIVQVLRGSLGITADRYDALGLDCDEYGAKNITAYDYDWNGLALLTA